jgi:hypothetical protein
MLWNMAALLIQTLISTMTNDDWIKVWECEVEYEKTYSGRKA